LYVKGRYLEIINVYYGTSFVCPKGDKAFAGAFVGFVSFIVMLLLVTLAVQIKRRRMLTLFPTLMLAVQLCIGKSPSVSEVVMLTLCTLWCFIADGNARTVAGYDANGSAQGNEALRIASSFLYMAAVSAVLFICVFAFKPLADTLADKKPQMLAFQKDLEGSVKSLFSLGIDLQDGTVSNHYPSYSEKTVMTVEAKAGAPSNIYLRSFYGDTYENGRWIKKSDFSGMEKEYHDASRMTAWQTTIGLATLLDGYYDDETNPATEKYTITMEKLSTKYTYLPYCIDPYSIDARGDIDFDEDFFITKDKGTKTIEVSACPGFFDGSLETSSLEPEQPLEVNNDFYAAYNNYVMENYTAKQGGDGIVAEDAKWLLRTGQLTSNMMYTGYIRENDANRIAAAQLVQQFLTSKAFKYSKNPPSTGGKDVVENFLSNSRQGFCVHFASAGTMILRQMGVPCRYVSGYCAKEDSFKSGENDEDICEVKDSQSHAWVEIYLDDFGWIPVEMTPGYFEYVTGENPFDYIGVKGKKTNAGDAFNDTENMNDAAVNEDNAYEDNADEDNADEDATDEDAENTDVKNDGSEKAYGSQSGADKRTDAQNSKTRLHIPPVILKTSLCVIFLTALTAIIVYIKRRRNILWEARLAKRVKKGRYSRVAIMINNRIYKGLGHPSKNRTDELYLANLKEKYCGPDYCGIHWDEYMRIIQKAVYSSEGITGEECFMVVETWRRLEKKDIRHNSQKNMYKKQHD
jgi:transglutaminase-like putative cysteine protease